MLKSGTVERPKPRPVTPGHARAAIVPGAPRKAPPPTAAQPYIYRLHGPLYTAWFVRTQRGGVKVTKYFGDRAWGGTAPALAAAIDWRDRQPWYHGQPPQPARGRGGPRGPRSGWKTPPAVADLDRYERWITLDGETRLCAFWVASWTDTHGKTWTRKFSVNFWGEDVARQKAQAFRIQYQRQVQALVDKHQVRVAQWRAKEAAQREAANTAQFTQAAAPMPRKA